MTDIDLAFEELELESIQDAEKEAGALLARLQRLRQERHVLIAIASVENTIFRLREERRISAGRVMAAKQAPPEDFP